MALLHTFGVQKTVHCYMFCLEMFCLAGRPDGSVQLNLVRFGDNFLMYPSSHLRCLIVTLRIFIKISCIFSFLLDHTLNLSEAYLPNVLQCILPTQGLLTSYSLAPCPTTFPFTNSSLGSQFQ